VTKGCDTEGHPPFAVTVDVAILSVIDGRLHVLLVRRGEPPFVDTWAIPGGFKRPDETLDEAAARELHEETGVIAPRHLAQFGAYGDPGRDPRGNVVTVGYLAVTPEVGEPIAGTDAAEARLWPVADVVDDQIELAFDHRRILTDALERARAELEDTDLATAFVGPTFTLTELQSVYEAIWGQRLDAANFRRSVAQPDAPYVEPTGERAPAGPKGGRRPELYRVGDAWQEGSPLKRSRRRSRPEPPPDEA
jgi:8-oxo-dGTP diphosphatase